VVLSGMHWEYFCELAENDGNMEQTEKSKKFQGPPPPKRPSTKKTIAFDWPVNIISNGFNPKHLDVFLSVVPCRRSCFFSPFVFCHLQCYLDVFWLLTKLMSFLNQNITLSWILTRNVQILKCLLSWDPILGPFRNLA